MDHGGHSSGVPALGWVAAAIALVVVGVYLVASVRLRRRGDGWSRWRDACCAAAGAALVVAALVPLPGGEFTAHMLRHLIIGMAAPLLLVLSRPLTLGLRALPPGPARHAVLAVAHSSAAAWLVFPPLAAAADVGGLWLLYRTRLFAVSHDRPGLQALVHVHVLVAGILFTAAVCQLDPVRRRHGLAVRAGTLVAACAAHAVLARTLWATAPPRTRLPAGDLHYGAMVMYYGGDLIEVALAAVVALRWYAAAGRTRSSRCAPAATRVVGSRDPA
ncbi:cytochrome c oxidase assembly protein [Actinoallomurus bryophytorum]|uniref:Putative membrane protein n=1 Tax=Actinoallomurus bryophytorum TaxID=1490222 RepID=A0A543CU52_9ACTN|nr:cytochrome c oxidase assembly protein [Actinoallomurus bryophytorum]TQM00643.1 putative membrane protein [Actinoallomurus bryophytorum]